jgi:hypothetical protein
MTGNVLVRGAVLSIILPWWLSGCPELPKEDGKLMAMAGLALMRWSRNRDNITMGLDDLVLTLQKEFQKLSSSRAKVIKRNVAALAGWRRWYAEKAKSKVNGIQFSEDQDSRSDIKLFDNGYAVDVCRPSTLPGNSPKPPKKTGSLRDK